MASSAHRMVAALLLQCGPLAFRPVWQLTGQLMTPFMATPQSPHWLSDIQAPGEKFPAVPAGFLYALP